MNSIEPWTVFFKEAGIPSVSAKNYVSIFDDNRITKEMLMDLDKEILREMGINIMGDVIAILKHAKKVYTDELKKKDCLSSKTVKSSVKVAPIMNTSITTTTSPKKNSNNNDSGGHKATKVIIDSPISVSPIIHPPKSSPSDDWSEKKLDTISADVQYTTTTYKNQQAAKGSVSSVNRTTDVIPPYGSSLHSDKILTHGFVKTPDKPLILEEYTTSTYEERMKNKRTSSNSSVIRTPTSTSPNKLSSRIVVIPPSLEKKPRLEQSMERSKRFLEAAGIIDTTDSFTVQHTPKHSVFSRLELSGTNRSNNPSSLKRSPSDIKGRLGKRVSMSGDSDINISNISTTLYSEQVPEEKRKPASIHDRLGPKEEEPDQTSSSVVECTMVADSVSRHSDVHARLKKKGLSIGNTPRGPLGKRLGQHAVFGRLE